MPKHTLDDVKKNFPIASKVVIQVNRGDSHRTFKAEVTGHRQTGNYIFIDTKDTDGVERSVRPGSLTKA